MKQPFDLIKPAGIHKLPKPETPVVLDLPESWSKENEGVYHLTDELATVINVALALDQPLLVTGEPGCGKTTLAWAVARQLGASVLEFHTKSTSVARDLFYTFDAVGRFHDASVGDAGARDAARYVYYQALGEAFRSDRSHVVLIDEIDKAPRDFPNDLLNELDRKEFRVPEITPPLVFRQQVRHFILVTSNSERRLPAPFLRRTLYYHIPYPSASELEDILAMHTSDLQISDSFVRLAVDRFMRLRAVEDLSRKPATGEFIGWVRALHALRLTEEDIDVPVAQLPAREVLVKIREDSERLSLESS